MKMKRVTRIAVISLALILVLWGGVARAAPGQTVISPQPERAFVNNLGMKFVYINPGSFMMGSPLKESGRDDDERQHRVTLTEGFYLQTTEVTQGQWQRVMGNDPSKFENCGSDCPVEQVSWNDVQMFIQKLNRMEKTVKYRLPNEAEWEYAARAGTNTAFSWGMKWVAQEQTTVRITFCNAKEKTPIEPWQWGVFRPTRGGFMTCMATSGCGVRTGTVVIPQDP
jgi:formylglycine-generating enzyme required for sulfatase activity